MLIQLLLVLGLLGFSFAEDKDIVIRVVCPANNGEGKEKVIRLKTDDINKLKKQDKEIENKFKKRPIAVKSQDVDDLDEKMLDEELKQLEKKKNQAKKKFNVDDNSENFGKEDDIDDILDERPKPKPKPKPATKVATSDIDDEEDDLDLLDEEEEDIRPKPKPKPKPAVVSNPKKVCHDDFIVYYDAYEKVMKYRNMLGLTKKQLALIQYNHNENLKKMAPIKREINRLKKKLDILIFRSDEPDVEDIKNTMIELATQKLNLSILNVKETILIKKQLTDRQWRILLELMKK